MPKLGKAGSLRSRQATVHSCVHTERWAIDLSLDIIARFGKQQSCCAAGVNQACRGLDVIPTTISHFCNGGYNETTELLENIMYPEEITHCVVGVKWFKYLCLRTTMGIRYFHTSTTSCVNKFQRPTLCTNDYILVTWNKESKKTIS